jgi:hypothetical protein
MIEAVQRLALEHINDVQGAPEAPQFRGNTLTLTAGFQPGGEVGKAMDDLRGMTSEEASKLKDFRGPFSGGGTGWAYEVGSKVKSVEDLQALRSARDTFGDMTKAAMASKDYTTAMDYAMRSQYAREAYEFATGVNMDDNSQEGSANSAFKRYPDYRPPMPGGEAGAKAATGTPGELHHAQFSPSEAPEAVKMAAIEDKENGTRFEAPIHLLAYSKALEAGYEPTTLYDKFNEGFTTNAGEFLNRKQAFARANEHKQILRTFPTKGNLTAEHMGPVAEAKTQYSPKENPVEDLAKEYANDAGIKYTPPTGHVQYDRDLAKRLAAEYDARTHAPDDPEVKRSYDAFTQETLDQFKKIQEAGYTLEPI